MVQRVKRASSQVAWSLLTEGVTQARVDIHRLRLMCDRAQILIDQSEASDHIYQVAGDMIMGLPDALSAAERSLDRTSYALTVMGEDFLRGRISLDDRERVDQAVKSAPFSSVRPKESLASRVARRFLMAQESPPTAESYFVHNPETHEVRRFNRSEALSNEPGIAAKSVKDSDSPDRTVSEARSEARRAPPTPEKIEKMPGGKEFSTLNRYLIQTDQPGVHGVPEGRDDRKKHPKLVG